MTVTKVELPEYFCLDCWRVHSKMTVLVHHEHPSDLPEW